MHDPEWTARDRVLALAGAAEADYLAADRCSGCGGSLTETTREENRGRWEPRKLVCFRCEVVDRERARIADAAAKTKNRAPNFGLLIFSSERRTQ